MSPSISIVLTESRTGTRVKIVPDVGASDKLWTAAIVGTEAIRKYLENEKATEKQEGAELVWEGRKCESKSIKVP